MQFFSKKKKLPRKLVPAKISTIKVLRSKIISCFCTNSQLRKCGIKTWTKGCEFLPLRRETPLQFTKVTEVSSDLKKDVSKQTSSFQKSSCP